jgi:hypothetical protein
VLVEDGYGIEDEPPVWAIIFARNDGIGFEYAAKSPTEHLSITWGIAQLCAFTGKQIQAEDVPGGARNRSPGQLLVMDP